VGITVSQRTSFEQHIPESVIASITAVYGIRVASWEITAAELLFFLITTRNPHHEKIPQAIKILFCRLPVVCWLCS
jgi:hypothetical protein